MTTPVQQPRAFQLIALIPTTGVLFLLGIALALGTALPILWGMFMGRATPVDGEWLIFVAGVLGIERLGFVGKRATAWKPPQTAAGVITAEPIDEAHPVEPAPPALAPRPLAAKPAPVVAPLPVDDAATETADVVG